ncbi:uncharacterized protein DS421_16g566170 [Arachis hypogaea]|nr:uncharacterized protein DS421_16g566170 [Arachis hypogaea]
MSMLILRRTTTTKPINNTSLGRIIATDLNLHAIPGQYSDEILSDFPRNISESEVLVVEANAEHAVGEGLGNEALVDPILLAGLVGRRGLSVRHEEGCRHLRKRGWAEEGGSYAVVEGESER